MVSLHTHHYPKEKSMAKEYNLCQQAFVLSIKANWLMQLNNNEPDTKANLEKRLYLHLTKDFLPMQTCMDYMGTWQIVWGPAVFSLTGIPDNVVYVARKEAESPVYVVAVAGTNDASTLGKTDEDGQVETTITWKQAFIEDMDGQTLLGDQYENPDPAFPNPCLSTGTALGVRCLLRACPNPDTNCHDKNPVRLLDYLKSLESNQATLIITGHSLGGALAPTLALALFTKGGPLTKKNWGAVYVLPTAGATPGNDDFSKSFQSVFPGIPPDVPNNTQSKPLNLSTEPNPSTREMWNRNIANKFDVVPLAWIPEEMDIIPPDRIGRSGIYQRLNWNQTQKMTLRKIIKFAEQKPNSDSNYPVPYGGSTSAGAYQPLPRLWFGCTECVHTEPENDTIRDHHLLEDYLSHWRLQHSTAYAEQIFKIDRQLLDLSPPPDTKTLRGMGTSLFEVPAAEMDVELD
jgi:hypothetical protein